MEIMLCSYAKDSQRFGDDLSSERSIAHYYMKYYERQKEQMIYPFTTDSGKSLNMYYLLARNRQLKRDNDINEKQKDLRMVLTQSFKTAAKHFKVIEEYGYPIVVPYKRGKDIISELLSENNVYAVALGKGKLLQKTQMYTVNIAPHKFRKMCNDGVLIYHERLGIYILREGYYHDIYGVSEDVVIDTKNYTF